MIVPEFSEYMQTSQRLWRARLLTEKAERKDVHEDLPIQDSYNFTHDPFTAISSSLCKSVAARITCHTGVGQGLAHWPTLFPSLPLLCLFGVTRLPDTWQPRFKMTLCQKQTLLTVTRRFLNPGIRDRNVSRRFRVLKQDNLYVW